MGIVNDMVKKRAENMQRLKEAAPNLSDGFNELMKHYYKEGGMERRYKELMAVACSVAARCAPCLAHHAYNAVKAGATRKEVFEAAEIGVEFGGGPSFVIVRDNLPEVLDDLESA